MRYVSPICNKKLLCQRPISRGHMVEAETTQKYDHKIPISWKIFQFFKSGDSPDIPLSNEV